MNPLSDFITSIHGARDAADLRARLFPALTHSFEALRGALFLFAELPIDAPFGKSPFAAALLERHAPLHEGQLASEGEWRAGCSRADHGHVLAGPIVQRGEMVGILGFTRGLELPSFDERNVSDLSALCLHVSTRMASWTPSTGFDLTPREREIAALVAQGKTNDQIGRALFVSGETVKAALKTMFRKTKVSSRAELVAALAGTA